MSQNTQTNISLYSVWIGGGEVNDYPLTLSEAQDIVQQYQNQGYDDVSIEQIN